MLNTCRGTSSTHSTTTAISAACNMLVQATVARELVAASSAASAMMRSSVAAP